ncbi:MAG: Rrf2 family transcriptional regulator [Acidobacteriota bacterium]|nr:Rrf2 family transcriptional regulator [Acidobacteriota bacterium]
MANLIHLSERASLAIHSMALLVGSKNGRATIRELADQLDASANHLAKVFQSLGKAGLLRSERGPAGGYRLNRPAEKISFLDVFEAVEGRVVLSGCPLGKEKCYFQKCVFSGQLNRITRDLYESMRGLNMASFKQDRRSS